MAVIRTVWDASGKKCVVRSVDAVEIIAAGGSATEPVQEMAPRVLPVDVAYTLEEAIEQNEGVDESTEAKAKKTKGKKAE